MQITCEKCHPLLHDLVDDKIGDADRAAVNAHLDECEVCSQLLAELWALAAMATRWQDRAVPHWHRRRFFFEGRSAFFPVLQVASAFASVAVMILVLAQAQVSTADGFSVNFGESYVSRDEVAADLRQFRTEQQLELAVSLDRLTAQQAASNQLIMRTLLEASREERKEELGQLVVLLDEVQDRRTQRTEASLNYLIESQLEDRRNIRQLGEAIRLVANEGGTL